MNSKEKRPFRFELEQVGFCEVEERASILKRFPGNSRGIGLETLSETLGIPEHRLQVTGINKQATAMNRQFRGSGDPMVLVALSQGESPATARAVLGVQSGQAKRTVDLMIGREPQTKRPQGISTGEQGVFLYALDRAGGDWIRAGGPSFVVRGFLECGQQIIDYLGSNDLYEVALRLTGEELCGDICLWFEGGIEPISREGNFSALPAKVGSWPVLLRVLIGWTTISSDDIAGLSKGDVVLLDSLNHPDAPPSESVVVLSSGKWEGSCLWRDHSSLEIVSREERRDSMKTKTYGDKEIKATLLHSEDSNVGVMDVMVQVELTELKLAVEQAAALLPGQILSLDENVGTTVNLRVGDKRIAKGELVECDGKMAVEIKEVL